MSDSSLHRTPLFACHAQEGARLVDFAGWQMPVQYGGISDEHLAVRQHAGRFDVSHMGRFYIDGDGAVDWLEVMLPARIRPMQIGQMAYSILCSEAGGAIDDLAIYRCSQSSFLLVVNASRTAQDLDFLRHRLPDSGSDCGNIKFEDRTCAQAMIAVQGPDAETVLADLPSIVRLFPDLQDIGFFRFQEATTAAGDWLLSRSGYTGEDGFEIICPTSAAAPLWQDLAAAGVTPVGLGARDTLRTEMGYSLYGHELTEQIGPVEAGLSWALALDKTADFCGRSALRQRQQGTKRLMGLRLEDKGIPRPGYEVHQAGRHLGSITSGTFSPSLKVGICLALVDTASLDPNAPAVVVVRGRELAARFVDLPFLPSKVKRQRRSRRKKS